MFGEKRLTKVSYTDATREEAGLYLAIPDVLDYSHRSRFERGRSIEPSQRLASRCPEILVDLVSGPRVNVLQLSENVSIGKICVHFSYQAIYDGRSVKEQRKAEESQLSYRHDIFRPSEDRPARWPHL